MKRILLLLCTLPFIVACSQQETCTVTTNETDRKDYYKTCVEKTDSNYCAATAIELSTIKECKLKPKEKRKSFWKGF